MNQVQNVPSDVRMTYQATPLENLQGMKSTQFRPTSDMANALRQSTRVAENNRRAQDETLNYSKDKDDSNENPLVKYGFVPKGEQSI